jgi:hypothetical protein
MRTKWGQLDIVKVDQKKELAERGRFELEQNFNTCASTEHINPAMNNAHIIAA